MLDTLTELDRHGSFLREFELAFTEPPRPSTARAARRESP